MTQGYTSSRDSGPLHAELGAVDCDGIRSGEQGIDLQWTNLDFK